MKLDAIINLRKEILSLAPHSDVRQNFMHLHNLLIRLDLEDTKLKLDEQCAHYKHSFIKEADATSSYTPTLPRIVTMEDIQSYLSFTLGQFKLYNPSFSVNPAQAKIAYTDFISALQSGLSEQLIAEYQAYIIRQQGYLFAVTRSPERNDGRYMTVVPVNSVHLRDKLQKLALNEQAGKTRHKRPLSPTDSCLSSLAKAQGCPIDNALIENLMDELGGTGNNATHSVDDPHRAKRSLTRPLFRYQELFGNTTSKTTAQSDLPPDTASAPPSPSPW